MSQNIRAEWWWPELDQGSTWNGNLGTPQPPHGLFLLRALAADCGTRRGKDGWVTWFTIPLATDHEPAP